MAQKLSREGTVAYEQLLELQKLNKSELYKLAKEFAPNLAITPVTKTFYIGFNENAENVLNFDGRYFGYFYCSLSLMRTGNSNNSYKSSVARVYDGNSVVSELTRMVHGDDILSWGNVNNHFLGFGTAMILSRFDNQINQHSFHVQFIGYKLGDSEPNPELPENPSEAIIYVETSGNDSTAVIGDATKPFLTIQAGLDASVSYFKRTVNIGIGRFAAPTLVGENTHFRGASNPILNDEVNPTQLIGGTVIIGTMRFTVSDISVKDLGVDVGPTTAGYMDAFVFAAPWNGSEYTVKSSNLSLINCTTLINESDAPHHGVLFEYCSGVYVDNVKTVNGMFGFALKSTDIEAKSLSARNHSNSGIIVKSDGYNPVTKNIFVDGFNYTGVIPSNREICILNFSGTLENVFISNVEPTITSYTKSGNPTNVIITDTSNQPLEAIE